MIAAKLEVRMVRYSFPVGLFHSLLHAGLIPAHAHSSHTESDPRVFPNSRLPTTGPTHHLRFWSARNCQIRVDTISMATVVVPQKKFE
jgi:hypothetical protein